ncbi:hypothetical protein NC653_001957 [Populus alba x Populus x berolinensis]|uniref:Uncharacterized protein n=1 Tax=Populus alba x Populus x berolinensis TaxID=444605 RepID=A0AAD6RMJ5_9ROSI|nr:hypothetical protein NC653_001957 [Populus alba x Populus x berolinensis]
MAVFNILSTSAGAGASLSSSSSFLILIIILTIILIIIIIILIIITVIKNSQPLVFITSLLSLLKPNQNHLQRESSLKWIPISSPSQAVDIPGFKAAPCIRTQLPAIKGCRVHCVRCLPEHLHRSLPWRTFTNLFARVLL